MRLIDADDVIKTISHYLEKAMYALYPNDKMPDFVKGMIDGYARARSIVFETPTVYPVKHGRWEDCSNGWMCSVCKHDARKDYPFCPYCGAKMDGDKNE